MQKRARRRRFQFHRRILRLRFILEEYFTRQIEIATRNGVEKIFIDPGLGFYYRNLQDSAVRVRHQMTTFLNTFRLRQLGFPTCHALPHAFEYFGDEVRMRRAIFRQIRLPPSAKSDLFRNPRSPPHQAQQYWTIPASFLSTHKTLFP